MIIDPTDFVDRPYKVPNQEEARDFSALLEQWEEDIACGMPDNGCQLLGVELWEEFTDALSGSGTIADKWLHLRDGATYTHDGKQYRYKGWVDMIRPALYSLWIPTTTWKLTNIGYVENSAPQQSKLIEDPYPFIVENWNKFVEKVGCWGELRYFGRSSFYGFMQANKADYPTWNFCAPHLKNRHDL